jgi:hypothetical protein
VCSTPCVFVPQIVMDLQSRLTALLVRMTAVEALLGQEPLLTGRYTAAPYRYISQVQCCVWQCLLLLQPAHVTRLVDALDLCTFHT